MSQKTPDNDEINKATLGFDEHNAVYTCPECGKLSNPRCGNCFHNAYKDEDPLEPGSCGNPEIKSKAQGKWK